MLACICCGLIEIPLGIMILSAIGWLVHKIKHWKCCCGCHKEHEKTKDEKENIHLDHNIP